MQSDTQPPPSRVETATEVTGKEMPAISVRALHLVVFQKEGVRVHKVPDGRTIVVGRSSECDVQIESLALSRKHFSVVEGSPARLRDLGSANGTRVNGKRVPSNETVPLEIGNLIEAGGVFFMLREKDPRTQFERPPAPGEGHTAALMRALVIEDPSMTRLHDLVDLVARSTIPVLVVGETGVGKEIICTEIHRRSSRAEKPYVRINCAALPETLLESELFGFERGAFTGAAQAKQGLIEAAHEGTFFLDEIGEMPLPTQAKLLRVLESGEILRVGALKPRTVDVRFIAATNRNLPQLVARGTFRKDLYFRLNGITIPIPPLRERAAEVPALARLFLSQAAKRARRRAPSLSPEAVDRLAQHSWPGNVRELKNVMDRALTICQSDIVRAEHVILDPAMPEDTFAEEPTMTDRATPQKTRVEERSTVPPDPQEAPRGRLMRMDPETERRLIVQALEQAGGNQSKASEILGISRRTLINRLDEYQLKRPRKG